MKGFVRDYEGMPAVFAGELANGRVQFAVATEYRDVEAAEWSAMPLWQGPILVGGLRESGWYVEGYFAKSVQAEWCQVVASFEAVEKLIRQEREKGYEVFRFRPPASASADELAKARAIATDCI